MGFEFIFKYINMESQCKEVKKSRKPFANLPITSPWRYRVPIYRPISKKKLNIPNKMIVTKKPINVEMSNFENNHLSRTRLIQLFPSVHPTIIHKILLESNNQFSIALEKLSRTNFNNYYPKTIVRPSEIVRPNYFPAPPKYFLNHNNCPTPQFTNYQLNIPIMNSKPPITKNLTYILPKYGGVEQKYFIKSDTIPKVQGIIAAEM